MHPEIIPHMQPRGLETLIMNTPSKWSLYSHHESHQLCHPYHHPHPHLPPPPHHPPHTPRMPEEGEEGSQESPTRGATQCQYRPPC